MTANRSKTINRSEEAEQARLVRWSHKQAVRQLMPGLRWLHHSPNGGKRDAFTGAQMKALGTKPGFPDLHLSVRVGAVAGLVIEMKTATGRESPEQVEWRDHFTSQGWAHALCRSAEQAREVLCEYFGVNPYEAPGLDE